MKQFVAETYYLLLSKKTLLNKRVLCSFSGGQDSTIVFFSLFHRKTLNQTINLVYFHHFWQIQNFQACKGIFHLSFNLKVPYSILISTYSLSNENRSRNWRKKKLFRFSNLHHTSIVVTGHTQTDGLETNLNNLIRGTSSKGVSFQNCFGAHRQENFYRSQNYPSYCFYPLVFSTSFVVLKFRSQPKKLSFGKKIPLRSKIFFSKVNSVSEKCVLPVLQTKFLRKANPVTEKLQNFKQSNLKLGETVFKPKVFPVPNLKNLGLTKIFWQEICIKKKLIGPFTFFKSERFSFSGRRGPLQFHSKESPKTMVLGGPSCPKISKLWIKRHFWDIQSPEIQRKSTNRWFCKQEEFHLSETLQKNKFFYDLSLPKFEKFGIKRDVFGNCNVRYTKKSNSFCFLNFSEQRTINQKILLKNQTRITVSKVAKIYNLPVFHDLTNFSYQSSRNKIRHIVFPLIGYIFQKKVDFSFTQFFSILINDTWESEKSSQKIYFLLDFFSIPAPKKEFLIQSKKIKFFGINFSNLGQDEAYSNLVENYKKFPALKRVFLGRETQSQKRDFLNRRWRVFEKKNETVTFENFLLMYICQKSQINFQLYILKKIIRDYTERELSFNKILNMQKIFAR